MPYTTAYQSSGEHVAYTARVTVEIRREDREQINSVFAEYASTLLAGKKRDLVARMCNELRAQPLVESQPAVQQALIEKEELADATVEHASMKVPVDPLDGEMFEVKLKVPPKYAEHHVQDAQTEMFPQAQIACA